MLVANGYAPDPRVHKEAKTLQEKGYSVSVVCWDRERRRKMFEVIDGIHVRRFRYLIPTGFLSFAISGLLFLIDCTILLLREIPRKNEKIVIHCHDFNTLPVGYLLRCWNNDRFWLVYDSHESFPHLLQTIAPRIVVDVVQALENRMLDRVDALITANDMILQSLHPSSQILSAAIYNTPPLSISSSSRAPLGKETLELRDKFGPESFVLLYYGALLRYRGLYQLLDAADLAKHLVKKVIFVIVGNGPLESFLRSEAERRKLTDTVMFHSHMKFEDIMLIVREADAIYIGFEPEDLNNYFASPNKLFEAMAMGKPVVASGFGLLRKLVEEVGCGVKLESIDGQSIVSAIRKLFDKEFGRKCGDNGLSAFSSYYNWDVMARRLESLYSALT